MQGKCNKTVTSSVFLTFFEGCRGGALGCQHYCPFCVWSF